VHTFFYFEMCVTNMVMVLNFEIMSDNCQMVGIYAGEIGHLYNYKCIVFFWPLLTWHLKEIRLLSSFQNSLNHPF
jgi:hypothetical protein